MENASAPEPRLARELATIPPLPFRLAALSRRRSGRGEGRDEGAWGRLAAGGAFGSGLPAAARERDDGKSSPRLLVARFTVRSSGELYLLLCWRLDFIGGFSGSLSYLLTLVPLRKWHPCDPLDSSQDQSPPDTALAACAPCPQLNETLQQVNILPETLPLPSRGGYGVDRAVQAEWQHQFARWLLVSQHHVGALQFLL